MPLVLVKRKSAPRVKLIRKKRMAQRVVSPLKRVMRQIRQPVQYFKRTLYYSGWTANSTTADTFLNYYGVLSVVPNYTEFTNLFDQYRINGIKIQLIPRGNSSDIGTSSASPPTGQSVGVFSIIDYDDINVLTSFTQAVQYQNLKMTRSHQIHSRYFKPRIANSVYNGAAGVVNAGSVRGWIDCDNPSVPHMGVKMVLQQSPNLAQTFDLKIDYYLAFKNVR